MINKWNNLDRPPITGDFNVLSCFDGMSCGQIALNKINAVPTKYFASEIDKYAMEITTKNFPDTIQVGSITDLLPQHLPKIDLLITGSPCQGFSFAGDTLDFEDSRSKLFFHFHRLYVALKDRNPDLIFLLENVRMHKKSQDVISAHMGVQPIMIDSALVSAQRRKRLYWTNITGLTQPVDRELILNSILEDVPNARPTKNTKRNREHQRGLGVKALTMTASMYKGAGNNGMSLVPQLSDTFGAANDGVWFHRTLTPTECERLQTVPEGYTEGVSNTQRYKMLGNGWTVDVIAHIFKQAIVNAVQKQATDEVLSLFENGVPTSTKLGEL